ncbi:unnamed protein product [Colias eurytheme]|nr:unnamed protein product [Colias eurytheme]
MMSVKFVALSVLCVIAGSSAHRQFQSPGQRSSWKSSNDDSISTISAARSANGWENQQFRSNDFGHQTSDVGPRYGAYKNSNNVARNCPCSASISDWKQFGSRSNGYQASW